MTKPWPALAGRPPIRTTDRHQEADMPEQDPTVDTTTDDVAPQVEDVLVEEVSIDGMCGVY
nr:mycofactocin precursor MftA [Jatrophihabitans endophyticus]